MFCQNVKTNLLLNRKSLDFEINQYASWIEKYKTFIMLVNTFR